jgi:hypothetical protein
VEELADDVAREQALCPTCHGDRTILGERPKPGFPHARVPCPDCSEAEIEPVPPDEIIPPPWRAQKEDIDA